MSRWLSQRDVPTRDDLFRQKLRETFSMRATFHNVEIAWRASNIKTQQPDFGASGRPAPRVRRTEQCHGRRANGGCKVGNTAVVADLEVAAA